MSDLGLVALYAGSPLAARPRRQPLVSDRAAVPAGGIAQLHGRHRSRADGAGGDGICISDGATAEGGLVLLRQAVAALDAENQLIGEIQSLARGGPDGSRPDRS